MNDSQTRESALSQDGKTFLLTTEHLALLRRSNVKFGGYEWQAPMIDGKRPYGNGDLVGDVCEILGWPTGCCDCGCGCNRPDDAAHMIHKEMEHALAILCAHPGEEITGRWIRAEVYFAWVRD